MRVFHWLMVLSFAGAWLTAESERWRLLHVTLGYTMAGLVAFRILWGLVGTRHARFASFVRGPAAVARYLRSLLRGQPEHHTGHNPAGALAIVALLGLALAVDGVAAGPPTTTSAATGSRKCTRRPPTCMLALVGVHVAGVLLGSWLHRENLVARDDHRPQAGPAGGRHPQRLAQRGGADAGRRCWASGGCSGRRAPAAARPPTGPSPRRRPTGDRDDDDD